MKKGIELSLNFLVTIIIALVIFGFGINFIYNLASEAAEMESMTTEDLDKRIGELLCESTDKVCIPVNKKTIQRGEFGVVGVKIINILTDTSSSEFGIDVQVSKGFKKNNEEITDQADLDKIDVKHRGHVIIEKNEEADIGIGVEVVKDAISGTYVLDVTVEYSDDETILQKIYIEVP